MLFSTIQEYDVPKWKCCSALFIVMLDCCFFCRAYIQFLKNLKMKQTVYLRNMHRPNARIWCTKLVQMLSSTTIGEIIKSPKSDSFVCAKLLTFEEYIQCKPEWFTEESWESLCKYWCSAEYLKRRKLGQDSWKKTLMALKTRVVLGH